MNWILAAILAYVGMQLVIGYGVSRRVRTEQDYLIAGRRMGPALVVFSVFATWFGAETCIGSAGEAYRGGLAAVTTDPFGYAAGILIMGLLVAAPLWRRQLTTVADLYRQRYGAGVERLAALIMVPTSLLWAAAQMRAFGQVLAASSSLEVTLAISLAAAVIVVYTSLGGMLADAISDLVQGCILITGLVILGVVMWHAGGAEALARLPAASTELVQRESGWLATLEAWSVPILGTLVAQELAARVMSARSPQLARNGTVSAAFLYLAVGLIPVGVGLAAASLLPGIGESEQVLIHVAQAHLPLALYVVFIGALVAAILTTADSALLVAGSLTAHNLVMPLLPRQDERHKLLFNRAAVVGFGVIAWVMALLSDGVYALVEEASSLGSAGLLVCLLFGLWLPRVGGALSAAAALLAGLAMYVLGSQLLGFEHPFISSVAAAFAAYLLALPFSPARLPAAAGARMPA